MKDCNHIVGHLPGSYGSSPLFVEVSDGAYVWYMKQGDFDPFKFCPNCGASNGVYLKDLPQWPDTKPKCEDAVI